MDDLAAQTDTVNVSEGSWSILATDGESFKNATTGTIGNLKIDARALVPDVFDLKQNYPNPFKASTTIEYDVDCPAHVGLWRLDSHKALNGRMFLVQRKWGCIFADLFVYNFRFWVAQRPCYF